MTKWNIRAAIAIVAVSFPPIAAFAVPPLEAVRHALVGTWQSTQDTRFTRELAADGSATDRYEGDAAAALKGTWIVFNGDAPPAEAKSYKMIPDATYLEIRQDGDVLFFGLNGLTTQSLQLVYLERGNQLSFVRLK